MSLGKKTLALFLVLGFAICLGSYLALRVAVLPAFADFEHQSSKEALLRVTQMLEAELRALDVVNDEYSAWDETVSYVQGRNATYEFEYLDPVYWQSIDIDFFLVFDAAGNQLYGHLGNLSGTDGHEIDDDLLKTLDADHPLVSHASAVSTTTGLLRTRSGVLQVASHPIVNDIGEEPVFGSFVIGQFLTEERIANLGVRATVDLSIHVMGETGLPAHIVTAFRNLSSPNDMMTFAAYAENIHGLQVLPDISGAPAAVLEVRQPRTISRIGAETIRTAMLFLAAGSIGFLLAALFFTQRLIVAPIQALTQKILNIQHTGDLDVDIGTARSDEVGVLAGNFAELTFGLGKAREELESARDEALSMSRAKTEFLARMSHEIRTPMNGVLGMTELLQNTDLNEKQERFADTIYTSAESLLHIINDILDISKIEAGKLELDIAPFNLRHTVEECLDLLADSAHRKELELVGAIPADTHTFVEGDGLRLRQILVNLLSNAVKFTERGEIIVRVDELQHDADSIQYRFEIEDTGVGIKPENLSRIFEPFSQEDGSTTRRYGGTGLGLSICKQLLDLMGGDIGAESTPGCGCTFWFTVRLKKDLTVPQLMCPDVLSSKRVLIVDDNATNRETLCHQLEGWDMRVEAACSGPEALGLLSGASREDRAFDIVLLDMNMPDMDGIELANTIRQTPGVDGAPLVMLSSVSGADVGDARSTAGIDAWLTKPVRQARLYDALVSHLGRIVMDVDRDALPGEPVHVNAENDNASRNLQILLAEDNPVNQAVAMGMLSQLGHDTTVVADGSEAVTAIKEQYFDLVLMDCQMPGVDGYKATKAIREWENEQGRAPTTIVALTANALGGDRERCLGAGMDDYISKPFTLQKLATVIVESMARDDGHGDTDPSDSNAHVLIVDDNAVNQQVTKAIANELGYSADVVSDGNEALRAMQSTQYALVFMDCHMPVRDGYSTSSEIRRLEELSSSDDRIPIVALTADLMQSNRERCLACGMDDYVSKPFTEEQLRIVLNRWLPGTNPDCSESEVAIDADGFSTLTETTSLASIDRLALKEIIQLDHSPGKTMVREIVVSYCAVSTRLMLQLRAAVAEGDNDEVEVLAHSLKGSSGQIGAILLSSLCEQLISGARKDSLHDAHALYERTAIEHSAVIIALDKELQRVAA